MIRRTSDLAPLVAEHSAWLSALLRGLTRSEADAEDAFQDVWMRLLKAGGIPEKANVRAYLAQTARSVVIDRYRTADRAELVLDVPDESGVERVSTLVDESQGPRERVEAQSMHEAVLAAVRALPTGPRETALLRIEAELKFQEIADQLGVPLGTVLTWMRTATEKLSRRLGKCNG